MGFNSGFCARRLILRAAAAEHLRRITSTNLA
jgi:hypothetical protein